VGGGRKGEEGKGKDCGKEFIIKIFVKFCFIVRDSFSEKRRRGGKAGGGEGGKRGEGEKREKGEYGICIISSC